MTQDFSSLKTAVEELDEKTADALLKDFLASNPSPEEALSVLEACQQGMESVGESFAKGDYFIGDLVFAGALLSSCFEKLKPVIGYDVGMGDKGVVVLGSVLGDIHYIGKNIYKVMLEAAGYKVYDIGIDQPPEAFAEAARKFGADIIGLSGLLTVSVESMKNTVEYIRASGIPRKVRIEIGGSIVNDAARKYTGADAWSDSAYDAVLKVRKWTAEHKHS